jgi:hypothetical protein
VLSASARFGDPADLALAGPHLVMLDALGEPAVHVIRRADGALVATHGRKGEGPGEYRGPRGLQVRDSSRLWVFDIQLKRLPRLDLSRIADGSEPLPEEVVTFGAGELPMYPLWIGDAMVSPGLFDGGRLGWFDRTGRLLRTTGSLPDSGNSTPFRVRQHAYTGEIDVSPDGHRIVLGTRHADRLEFYGADGTLQHLARTADPFEPVFQVGMHDGQPYMASGEDMRLGYLDVDATDEAVYALFSGRRRADWPGRAAFGRTVHVYGWDGRLRRTLALDTDVIAIVVDEGENRLYAARHEPTPAVLWYPLSPPA